MSGVLAIIPARGGPKGLPREDLRPFRGEPLLVHSIGHAREAPSVTRIVVPTGDDEVAAVARRHGAEVVPPPAVAGGAGLASILDRLEAGGDRPELVVCLPTTSPLRRPGAVEAAIALARREGADSLFSACPVRGAVWRSRDGRIEPLDDDTGPSLVENGSIYAFRPDVLREHGGRPGGRVVVLPDDPPHLLRADEPGGLAWLERLAGAGSPHPVGPDLSSVRLLVLDFDGVMTDNRVLVAQDGAEAVLCHRGDGWGIARLRERGMPIVVISTEANPVVQARCRKLRLDFVQACDDKLSELRRLADRLGLVPDQIAYVGNDVNDLDCLGWVGLPIVVADAMPEVLGLARLVTTRPGGFGAVREVCDWLIAAIDRRGGV